MKSGLPLIFALAGCLLFVACKSSNPISSTDADWVRDAANPILRDSIQNVAYEVASDAHVFYDQAGELKMVYAGDVNGNASIKFASGSGHPNWKIEGALLSEVGPSGKDIQKETPFYRFSATGKHQIFYIGYEDETTYQSEVYLAEADELEGPYVQREQPVVSRGILGDKDVYLITSPSVVEHEGMLYMSFLAWNDAPANVSSVWVMGATSSDEGHTWTDFREVETPIGMEGQVSKVGEEAFVAVRTTTQKGKEVILYATAPHPFGPWKTEEEPILTQAESELEKDEVIAPQILIDPVTQEEYLYYTGADHAVGWWIMLAKRP